MTHFTSHTETQTTSPPLEEPHWLVDSTNQTDEDMITCENCGHCWDGYAQCSCYGIPLDDEPLPPTEPYHPMTLRSHTKIVEAFAQETET